MRGASDGRRWLTFSGEPPRHGPWRDSLLSRGLAATGRLGTLDAARLPHWSCQEPQEPIYVHVLRRKRAVHQPGLG